MKTRIVAVMILAANLLTDLPAVQGAPFQNLDFEAANLPLLPPGQPGGLFPIAGALPGWTGLLGTEPESQVLYNLGTLGSSAITVQGPNSTFVLPLAGTFTAVLLGGLDPRDGLSPLDVTLQQVGLVPADARSIQFIASSGTPFLPRFTVSLDSQEIPLISLLTTAEYTLFAGDVSPYAGETSELRITASGSQFGPNLMILDSIRFSPEIPEPSSLMLLGLAVLWFFRRCGRSVQT